ncbi:hypothetical protein F2Q70_00013813 [Brassica cretica]|uniref:Pentacotripeptide-repeat region of PRORP domain-containing protein n=1 Tax=Brassica cretica TaxID=69181 RepID=A0A8S9LPB1_BRACR|nr:hypothetical protein F2Q70_00013813 [Brassica cretica]
MSTVKKVTSFKLASLLRRENDPSAAIKLFRNPDPESTNPQKPFRYSLLCYDLIITKLGSSKMFDELDQILLQLKSDTRIVPTEIIFCNVVKYFARGRLPTRALHVFDEMPQYRCQRTIKSFNSLLNALLKCGAFDEMKKVLTRVDEYGEPDACTYNILINGFSQSGRFDEALKLFDEMVKKKVKPTGVTFGTIIRMLCNDLKVNEALKMKHDMLKVYGVFPTVHIYASLIKALCQVGELGLAFKLKDEVKADSAIYSTLISSLIKAGRSDEVSGILEEMREKGCEPDTVTYNVLINGFCLENDFESAYKVLDDMVEKGLKPDVISYNMILGALFRIQNWKEGAYLFEDMPRRGCVPDVLSYRIVFDGLCEGLKFEEAAVILDEMMFKGYKPRRDRLERFLQRLCESEKMEILGDVISSLNKGNAYDADFWKSVLKGVGRLDFPAKQARGMNLGVKMVQKKVAVLYHYPCHDGVFAALAAHLYFSANSIPSLFFPNTVYSPITISQLPLQDISHLYLLDFTGPPGFVQQVSPKVNNVVILDHHKTAIESLGDVSSTCKNVTKVLDIGRSGATIAFDYFTQKLKEESRGNCREMDEFKRMRRVFEYIEDADIWKWNLPESKAFNSGIIDLGIEYNFNQNSSLFQQLLSLDHDTVINRGRESLSRKRKLIQEALEQSYEIVLGGGAEEFGRCLAVNGDEIAELRSELGNQLAEKSKNLKLRGVGAVVYRVPELGDETKLKISLRSVVLGSRGGCCRVAIFDMQG